MFVEDTEYLSKRQLEQWHELQYYSYIDFVRDVYLLPPRSALMSVISQRKQSEKNKGTKQNRNKTEKKIEGKEAVNYFKATATNNKKAVK